jgi:hypothetical protein
MYVVVEIVIVLLLLFNGLLDTGAVLRDKSRCETSLFSELLFPD